MIALIIKIISYIVHKTINILTICHNTVVIRLAIFKNKALIKKIYGTDGYSNLLSHKYVYDEYGLVEGGYISADCKNCRHYLNLHINWDKVDDIGENYYKLAFSKNCKQISDMRTRIENREIIEHNGHKIQALIGHYIYSELQCTICKLKIDFEGSGYFSTNNTNEGYQFHTDMISCDAVIMKAALE